MKKIKITCICGSTRKESSNLALLEALPFMVDGVEMSNFMIGDLDAFHPDLDVNPLPESVKKWRATLNDSDALVICTPEYLHNMPAILKNALEWLATSGELNNKPVLPITFTPHPPRGEKAMQSLIWTLQALDAKIITSMSLYKSDFQTKDGKIVFEGDGVSMLKEALELVKQGK